MKDDYSVTATDQSTRIVTIVTDRGKKSIRQYGQEGPHELWAIHTLIDGMIANARDWQKIGPPVKRKTAHR